MSDCVAPGASGAGAGAGAGGIKRKTAVSPAKPPAAPTRGLRDVPFAGVSWAANEAAKRGFGSDPDWCNLGQGQPEVGDIDGASERVSSVTLSADDHEYGPLGGLHELRAAIAAHYNRLYRQEGKKQYTAANVSVAGGGRGVLARLFAALSGRVGYRVPDYAAYQDLFESALGRVTPVHVKTEEEDNFAITGAALRKAASAPEGQRLDGLLISNPCNPTGDVVSGKKLAEYCDIARDTQCLIAVDEFYSHYIYKESGEPGDRPVSCAEFITDPDADPVLVIDGMTKCFRYPGWRVGWVLGPPAIIEALNRAGSALDGGPSVPTQRLALKVLHPSYVDKEMVALRTCFTAKRNMLRERLRLMGIRTLPCLSTFYVWGCVAALPPPLNDGITFFRMALDKKVLTVPGHFFDINPAGARDGAGSSGPFANWVRFSFGPCMETLESGVGRLEALVREHTVEAVATTAES